MRAIIVAILLTLFAIWYGFNSEKTPGKGWLILGGVAGFFIIFKSWALHHPKSSIGIVVAALITILEEPAEAQ